MTKGRKKVMNPTDSFRKAEREKEKKRNRKERVRVREESMLRKDSSQIKDELSSLKRKDFLGQLDESTKKRLQQLESMWIRLHSKMIETENSRRDEEAELRRRALEKQNGPSSDDSGSDDSDSDDSDSSDDESTGNRSSPQNREDDVVEPVKKKGRWDVMDPTLSQQPQQTNSMFTSIASIESKGEDHIPPDVLERLKALRGDNIQQTPSKQPIHPPLIPPWFLFPHMMPSFQPTVPALPTASSSEADTSLIELSIALTQQPQSEVSASDPASAHPVPMPSPFSMPFPSPSHFPFNPMLMMRPPLSMSYASSHRPDVRPKIPIPQPQLSEPAVKANPVPSKVSLFIPTQLRVQQPKRDPRPISQTSTVIRHLSLAPSSRSVNQSMIPSIPIVHSVSQPIDNTHESTEDLEKAFQDFMNEVSQT